MISMLAPHRTGFTMRPASLQRRWSRSLNRLLVFMLVSGAGSIAGTVFLVASSRGMAQDMEAEGRILAQLRQDVVAETIFISGVQGPDARGVTTLAGLEATVREGFSRAHDVALSPQGHGFLQQAQVTWANAIKRIEAVQPGSSAAVHGLVIAQVATVEAPKVLNQLDQAGQAGRTAARDELARDKELATGLIAGLVALLLLGLVTVKRLGRRLTREVLGPVSLLRASADQLAAGDLSHRVALHGGDELGRLGASFNAMADTLAGSQRRLTLQANQDALTGLANRAGFRSKVEAALVQPDRRLGEQALLFIDLDDFKDVNDLFGHGAGDELLRVVATRLAEVVRPGNLVARLGGDEFAVHLDNVPSPHAAFELAGRLVAALGEPAVVLGRTVQVGASIGLAMMHDESDLDRLMQEADMAMYAAKGQGKNRVECYDASLHHALVEHHTLRADVTLAVARDELVLEYQPLVDLISGELKGVEALVRWQHPTRGLLPPSSFVELAEQTGAMPEMGMWVLKTALARISSWQRRYDRPDLTLAVNVSALQLADPGFLQAVEAALSSCRMRPETLTLEVTESMIVDAGSPVPKVLQALQRLGVRVAIDDFGTGYASIGHLKILPVDVLKIDRSFVVGAREDSRGEILLGGLVNLAAHLGLDVIPEGIEFPEDLQRVQRLGCVQGQGFLLSRPISPEDLEEWLVDTTKRWSVELGELPPLELVPMPRPPTADEAAERQP